jgi:hypothetical protein
MTGLINKKLEACCIRFTFVAALASSNRLEMQYRQAQKAMSENELLWTTRWANENHKTQE